MHQSYLDLLETFFIILILVIVLVYFANSKLLLDMEIIWYDFFNASRLMT